MAQNSNISISSGTTRFINAPIGRKKRAISSKKPMTDRLTYREENISQEASANCADRKFFGKRLSPCFQGVHP